MHFFLVAHCLIFSHNQPFRLGRGGDAHGRGGGDAQGGEGGCTCILCIPPGYAPGYCVCENFSDSILLRFQFRNTATKSRPEEEKNLDLLELEDVGGDLNEEGVQLALVPLSEDPAHLLVSQMQSILKILKPILKVVFAWKFLCLFTFIRW